MDVQRVKAVEESACISGDDGHKRFKERERHILPNALSPIIVLATLELPAAILVAASLPCLGPGARPSSPEWGAMLVDGRDSTRLAHRHSVIA